MARRHTMQRGASWLGRLLDRPLPTANWFVSFRNVVLPLALLLLVFAGSLAPAAHADAGNGDRILPQLAQDGAKNPNKTFRVVITRHNNNGKADERVQRAGGKKLKDIPGVEGTFVAEVSGGRLAELSKAGDIAYIGYDAEMTSAGTVDPAKLATLYPKIVKASSTWGTKLLTGGGVGVAILDTGVDSTLPDFKDANGISRVRAQVVFNAASPGLNDGNGHGTHIAGIIGGNSWRSSNTAIQGKYVGIAPEANIISVKVADDTGKSYMSDVAMGIYWIVQNRQAYNIRVLNVSMISGVAESARTSLIAAAVEYAWFNGIFVVTAAGNGGPNTMQYGPANDPFVMTVGAADALNTTGMLDDTIAPWSSFGITQDGYSKPEVVAPGRYMVSTSPTGGSTLSRTFPDRIVDSTYLRMSGTSMAAPVISGMAALIFQAHPEWTNDQVKWLMQNKATKLLAAPLGTAGAGEPDLASILGYVGTPGFANQGLPMTLWLTTLDGSTTYNSAAWTTANWSTANWSTANWSTANWSTANWSTANWSTTSTTTNSYPE